MTRRIPTGRRLSLLVFTVATMATAASCTAEVAGNAADPGTRVAVPQAVPGTGDSAERTYGYGPSEDPAIRYRPDVVLIGGGPDAIKAMSDDGLSFTMDSAAAGVSDLAEDTIMFASGMAVGRVASIDRSGTDPVVTLAPVELTDLVDGGSFDFDAPIDPEKFHVQDLPGLNAAAVEEENHPASYHGGTVFSDGVFRRPGEPARHQEPDDPKAGEPFSIGSTKVRMQADPSDLGLQLTYNKADLIIDAGIHFQFDGLGVRMKGQPGTSGFEAVVTGLKGLTLDLKAGLGDVDPSGANKKLEATISRDLILPIPPGPETLGLPMYLKIGFGFQLISALGARNSTISAAGAYSMSGDLGVVGTSVQTPTFDVKKSVIEGIDGISLAPSGIVAAVKLKITLGVGVAAAMAGPHVYLTAASGISKGSVLAINPDCRYASLDVTGGVGVGLDVDNLLLKILKKKVEKLLDTKLTVDVPLTVIHREQTLPEVAACQF